MYIPCVFVCVCTMSVTCRGAKLSPPQDCVQAGSGFVRLTENRRARTVFWSRP